MIGSHAIRQPPPIPALIVSCPAASLNSGPQPRMIPVQPKHLKDLKLAISWLALSVGILLQLPKSSFPGKMDGGRLKTQLPKVTLLISVERLCPLVHRLCASQDLAAPPQPAWQFEGPRGNSGPVSQKVTRTLDLRTNNAQRKDLGFFLCLFVPFSFHEDNLD